ncbi:zinc-ribbon domain-containing protein, partial [Williamsia sp. SKLECPSW1]
MPAPRSTPPRTPPRQGRAPPTRGVRRCAGSACHKGTRACIVPAAAWYAGDPSVTTHVSDTLDATPVARRRRTPAGADGEVPVSTTGSVRASSRAVRADRPRDHPETERPVRDFNCRNCGQQLSFENTLCLHCHRALGFHLPTRVIHVVDEDGTGEV